MSEETQPAPVEVIPPPRFDLRNAKPPTYNESIERIMSRFGLERWKAEGVMGDLIMRKTTREGQDKIAARWGVAFGEVSSCYWMGKITIDDSRAMMGTKSLTIANAALDALMDDFNDPAKVKDMKAKDKLAIAKQMTDNALNLENKSTGGGTTINASVGDVQILIQNREAREKSGGGDVAKRLLARGINPKVLAKAQQKEVEGAQGS